MNLEIRPLLSIITVVFNGEKYLEQTINSVISQNIFDLEYIIVDGGSTDGTVDIIKKYHDKIALWVTEPDKGIYDAMNKGVVFAKGEWILFLNAGDVFYSKETLFSIFANRHYNCSIIYGDTFLKQSKEVIRGPKVINKNYFFSNTICHQSIFFNRKLFSNVGCFDIDFKILADRIFLLKACMLKFKFEYVDELISVYDQDGYSSKNNAIYLKEQKILRMQYFSFLELVQITVGKIFKLNINYYVKK